MVSLEIEWPTVLPLEPITKLWPSIVVALVITLYRMMINKVFANIASQSATRQTMKTKPEWINTIMSDENWVFIAKNKQHIDLKGNTLKKRKINGINATNNGDSDYSQTDLEEELEQICSEQAHNDLYTFFNNRGIALSKTQKRELKSYHKAVNEYELKRSKFLESIFKASTVSMIGIYGFYVCIIRNDFFIHHRNQWPAYPDTEPYHQEHDVFILWYYIISIGYHLQRTLLQFHNPSRKDFLALMIHHWSTITLLIFSYFAAFLRTGSLVLFIHESSDIFLESAKICGYLDLSSDIPKDLFFGLFFLSWIIMRMFCFSWKVLYEIIRFGSKQLWIGNSPLFFNWTCVILLFVLEGLHIYWFKLILGVLKKKLYEGNVEDIRSGTDNEEEETNQLDKHKKQLKDK